MTPWDYEILSPLAWGSDAVVHTARRRSDGAIVALKLFEAPASTAFMARLRQEVALLSRLDHSGLVQPLDHGLYDGHPCLILRLEQGRRLDLILAQGPMTVGDSLKILSRLADSLARLHEAGAVHRDVKPANIIIRPNGEPVLLDLSSAALTFEEMAPGTDMVGCPATMAPEILNDGPADGRADLFSLGVVGYWMLSGRRPFAGNGEALAEAIRHTHPEPLELIAPWVPESLAAIIRLCLEKQPHQRPTARQLSHLLESLRPIRA